MTCTFDMDQIRQPNARDNLTQIRRTTRPKETPVPNVPLKLVPSPAVRGRVLPHTPGQRAHIQPQQARHRRIRQQNNPLLIHHDNGILRALQHRRQRTALIR